MVEPVVVVKQNISSQNVILFDFPPRLTLEQAEQAICRWKEILTHYPNQRFTLIWQCSRMQEYEPTARIAWQQAMKDTLDQTQIVYIVSASPIIKAGAYLMNAFSRFTLKPINSLKDLPFRRLQPAVAVRVNS